MDQSADGLLSERELDTTHDIPAEPSPAPVASDRREALRRRLADLTQRGAFPVSGVLVHGQSLLYLALRNLLDRNPPAGILDDVERQFDRADEAHRANARIAAAAATVDDHIRELEAPLSEAERAEIAEREARTLEAFERQNSPDARLDRIEQMVIEIREALLTR